MRAIFALAAKDLRLLQRRKLDAFFVFAFPALFAAFFTQIVSGSASGANRIRLAVVDQARTHSSERLLSSLQEEPGLRIAVTTRDDAERSVRKGRRPAYLLMPAGFGSGEVEGKLTLGVDPARPAEAGLLEGVLARLAGEWHLHAGAASGHRSLMSSGPSPTYLRPFGLETTEVRGDGARAPSPAAITLPQGLVWGLIACAAAFGASLVNERAQGTLTRLLASPITVVHVLAGKGLACFLTILAVSGMLLGIGGGVLDVTPPSWPMLAAAVASCGLCFVGLMMLVAVLGRTPESANRMGWAMLLVMAMLGGAMVPAYLMPDWLIDVGRVSPVQWSILALEGALWRGFTWEELALPCGVLVGIGAGGFLLGASLFSRSAGAAR